MTCKPFAGGIICGPSSWVVYSRESIGERWCFGCRKQTEHFWVVEGDDSPDDWYGPSVSRKCGICDKDRTAGFGREIYYGGEDE